MTTERIVHVGRGDEIFKESTCSLQSITHRHRVIVPCSDIMTLFPLGHIGSCTLDEAGIAQEVWLGGAASERAHVARA